MTRIYARNLTPAAPRFGTLEDCWERIEELEKAMVRGLAESNQWRAYSRQKYSQRDRDALNGLDLDYDFTAWGARNP
jgi:hypothetical protein